MKKLLLLLLGVMLSLPTMARDFTYEYKGQTLTYSVIEGGDDSKAVPVKVMGAPGKFSWETHGTDISGELEIPGSFSYDNQSYKVCEIADRAFSDCSKLTSVSMPLSITKIGESAFYGCSSLTEVKGNDLVNELGRIAFFGCSSLSKTGRWNCKIIPYAAFFGCSSLTLIMIDAATSIDSSAFRGCSSLSSVVFNKSLSEIGESAFLGCSSLKRLTIPKTVENVGSYAFENCSGLTSVLILCSNAQFGLDVFEGCSSLPERCPYPATINDPFRYPHTTVGVPVEVDDVESIDGTSYFQTGWLCSENKKTVCFAPYIPDGKYYVPDGYVKIGKNAYSKLDNITEITIDDNVTSIADGAFSSCPKLETVTLPLRLESLGDMVFENSKAIKNVIFKGPTPVAAPSGVFDSTVYDNATLYVRSGRTSLFMGVSPWKYFFNITDKEYVGIEDVSVDEEVGNEIYNLNGMKVADSMENLYPGIYIVRKGQEVKKIVVK